ncbi:phage holin family protein [Salinisphaera sp.]|uniref:phage holin family protein n=1 Tax=Salinisphaera sp. TaxID=1914330 RepID=UPI002D78AAED|nr:phage holin family protein [Salinisphaera sp.]HET7313665.1 phage holin family protein [Salinisphaera sp.]
MDSQNDKHDDHGQRAPEDRAIGSLIRSLMLELMSLVRNEAALARAEVSEKVTQLQGGVASLVIAFVLLTVGLIGLMQAAIFGLAHVLPMWLSALIIGGAIVLISLLALAIGRSLLKARNMTLEHTARELQKEASFAREQTR